MLKATYLIKYIFKLYFHHNHRSCIVSHKQINQVYIQYIFRSFESEPSPCLLVHTYSKSDHTWIIHYISHITPWFPSPYIIIFLSNTIRKYLGNVLDIHLIGSTRCFHHNAMGKYHDNGSFFLFSMVSIMYMTFVHITYMCMQLFFRRVMYTFQTSNFHLFLKVNLWKNCQYTSLFI